MLFLWWRFGFSGVLLEGCFYETSLNLWVASRCTGKFKRLMPHCATVHTLSLGRTRAMLRLGVMPAAVQAQRMCSSLGYMPLSAFHVASCHEDFPRIVVGGHSFAAFGLAGQSSCRGQQLCPCQAAGPQGAHGEAKVKHTLELNAWQRQRLRSEARCSTCAKKGNQSRAIS